MKNNRQYRDSAMFTFIGYVGIIFVILLILLGFGGHTGFNEKVIKGLQEDPRPINHLSNYTHPNQYITQDTIIDSLELSEPDMFYYDTVEWQDMMDEDGDCGGEDSLTNRWEGKEGQSEFGEYVPNERPDDSIPSYDSFINVPALEPGGDTIIMVDGILYQINNDENKWLPLYPDEHVMWITGEGDTIWE